MDQVAITAKHHTFAQCVELAHKYEVGIEVQSFAFPPLVDDDEWGENIALYHQLLADFPYPLSLHGAFMDMAPGSPDKAFTRITKNRSIQSLHLARELNADTVVFHANFLAMIRDDEYRSGWTKRTIDFFGPIAEYAENLDIKIALENMWEFDPAILRAVLEGVNSPALNACLDVGHAHLFSSIPFKDWLDELGEWIHYVHMNNNYGDLDTHLGLDDGILDYPVILSQLRGLNQPLRMVLEIEDLNDIERSLQLNWLALEKK